MKQTKPSFKTRAFSLVEVVLALGVTSFALLGMVALLPMGLKTSHQAIDMMTQAQIVQYAKNQLELTPFANLSTWTQASSTLYFDNQGLPTTKADPEQIYTVTFALTSVMMSTNSGTGASGSAAATLDVNPNAPGGYADAKTVQLTIVNRTMAGPSAVNVFSIVVPNAGF